MSTFTVQEVAKSFNDYSKAEAKMIRYIVAHADKAATGSEGEWNKVFAPVYKSALAQSERYGSKESRAVMLSRVKSIFLAAANGIDVDVNKSWAAEAKRASEILKGRGIVKVTQRGAHNKVTAGKAVNTKAAVAAEASEAKAKSRRQQVKVFTREQLLEAAFIVTGNSDLATLLVTATLGHRDQLSKALRAICAE